MPKILINEIDGTAVGTPGSYSNYSVLLAGFAGETKPEKPSVAADSNGVYEFTSFDDFVKTIGERDPKIAQPVGDDEIIVYHYGNAMARELLKLGYTVVYKTITSIDELATEDFWEIFRDKASYDFRFITHGLLESGIDPAVKEVRLAQVNEAIEKLKEIENSFVPSGEETDEEVEKTDFCNEEYAVIRNNFEGFINKNLETPAAYDSYYAAKAGTSSEKAALEVGSTINLANGQIANLAQYKAADDNANTIPEIPGRGDCIALIELDETSYTNNTSTDKPETQIIKAINAMGVINENNGKYCALTVPSVYYEGFAHKMPGAFHYLACFRRSLDSGFAEWYATAGYTRGVSSYKVKRTSVKLGEIAINALEPRNLIDNENAVQPVFACNVIANFRGSYYLWGNRTAHLLGSKAAGKDLVASHFLNIRQLCTTIKKQLYVACRRFTFDPNSDTLWFNFVNAIRPTLDAMKADQGIRDYKILKVYTDKKATLKAKIRIIPIEAVEDFDLEVYLEDSFGEVSVVIPE